MFTVFGKEIAGIALIGTGVAAVILITGMVAVIREVVKLIANKE